MYLFDEPFNALDIQAMNIFSRILMILKNKGRIVIVASHSFPFPDNLYNHVWYLSNGIIQDHSNKKEIYNLLDNPFQAEGGEPQGIDIPWILNERG